MVTSKPSGTNHPNPFRDASPPRHRTESNGRVRKIARKKNDKRRLLYGAVTKIRNGEDTNPRQVKHVRKSKRQRFQNSFSNLIRIGKPKASQRLLSVTKEFPYRTN